ncbi:hypothetical protein KAW65_03910 [candidate division WOR-3 bacterium]|nr:hypothetical protein [candidate division WOR-3 bacterium]
MQEEAKTLWRLQKLDIKISQLESRKESIPFKIQQFNKNLQIKEQELQEKHKAFQEFTERRRQLEIEIEELRDKARRYKSQLIQVKTNKEYQALLHEINTEETKISAYEEEIIDILGQSDELSEKLGKLKKDFEKTKEESLKHNKALQAELSEVTNTLTIKKNEQVNLAKKVNPVILSKYKQIQKSRNGIGIVGVSGSVCKGCNAILPPQFVAEIRKGDRILTCEQCGRILVWEKDVD